MGSSFLYMNTENATYLGLMCGCPLYLHNSDSLNASGPKMAKELREQFAIHYQKTLDNREKDLDRILILEELLITNNIPFPR